MKKKFNKKLWIICGVTVVIAAAVVVPLLVQFIPKLTSSGSKLNDRLPEIIVPPSGQVPGKPELPPEQKNTEFFIKYDTVASIPNDQRIQTIEQFAYESLRTNEGMSNFVATTVSNILTNFFANIKNSKSYLEKYQQWIKSINESFDDTVESYKDRYGVDWKFYFQLKELDPVGGNVDDWKRSRLFDSVNAEFDSMFQAKSYINLVKKDLSGNKQIFVNPSEEDLFNPAVIFNKPGEPCNIEFFTPLTQSSEGEEDIVPLELAGAFADLQKFVFDEWVKTDFPIITSMVLYKHEAPSLEGGYSKYFNTKVATELNNGTNPVPTEPSYVWQAFKPETFPVDGSTNATGKYNKFVKNIQPTSSQPAQGSASGENLARKELILDNMGGAINIPVEFTDDSATLYFIKATDVFDTSFTQYAAASIYKLNNLLYGVTDETLPSINGVQQLKKAGDPNVEPGNEIMSNFFQYAAPNQTTTTASASQGPYYFQLPEVVKQIINDDPRVQFEGLYNGVTAITDTVDIKDSPFIITRNEAGVHIIGIDRYDAINDPSVNTIEKKLTEIKNTLLWRHVLSNTKNSSNVSASQTTGFSIDLWNDIKSFYTANRNELILKYIISKQKQFAATPPTVQDKKNYIFSDLYSDMSINLTTTQIEQKQPPILVKPEEVALFEAYFNYIDYSKYSTKSNTVREKILGLQSNYIGKSFGPTAYNNAFIVNGLAGMLPYFRNTTPNDNLAATGVFDDVYGTYESVTPRFLDGQIFKNITLKQKEEQYTQAVKTYLEQLKTNKSPLIMKELTYETKDFNQWLQVGNVTDPKSSNEFANSGERINQAISSWISSNKISNVVISQKIKAYLTGKNAGIDLDRYKLFNGQGNINTIPTTNADSLAFISSRLDYAFNLSKRFTSIDNNVNTKMGTWNSFNSLYELLVNNSTAQLVSGFFSDEQMSSLRSFLTILKAFNYDEKQKTFLFNDFRDYLLEQTDNNGKAAFVWTSNDRINYLDGYYGLDIQKQFKFKPQMFDVIKDTYGYGYQYANKDAIVPKEEPSGRPVFDPSKVTFDNRQTYWRIASPDAAITNPNNSFAGFLGIQYPSSTSSDLDSSASTMLFSSSAKYFTTPQRVVTDTRIQGVLYNLASTKAEGMKILQVEIKKIRNNQQKQKMFDWITKNFKSDSQEQAILQEIETLKKDIIQASDASVYVPKLLRLSELLIPEEAFTRVRKQQLVNTSVLVQQPSKARYFGQTNNMASQVLVTQFNHSDVVKLFDTSGDGIIDSEDQGINWKVAASDDGFLGVSPEAFFISAVDWFNSNSLYANTAFNDMRKKEGKFETFDRRLNDLFGEDWVEGYKKNDY